MANTRAQPYIDKMCAVDPRIAAVRGQWSDSLINALDYLPERTVHFIFQSPNPQETALVIWDAINTVHKKRVGNPNRPQRFLNRKDRRSAT